MHNFSRRSLLRGAAAVPTLFASSHTLALGSASNATSEPWGDTASIGNSPGALVRLSARANALLESLDSAQRKVAWYRNLADSARTRWSNFPAGASPRAGISIGGSHVHAITRDPQNDYGMDWLALHYTEGNPIPGHFGPPPNGPLPKGGPPNGPPPKHR